MHGRAATHRQQRAKEKKWEAITKGRQYEIEGGDSSRDSFRIELRMSEKATRVVEFAKGGLAPMKEGARRHVSATRLREVSCAGRDGTEYDRNEKNLRLQLEDPDDKHGMWGEKDRGRCQGRLKRTQRNATPWRIAVRNDALVTIALYASNEVVDMHIKPHRRETLRGRKQFAVTPACAVKTRATLGDDMKRGHQVCAIRKQAVMKVERAAARANQKCPKTRSERKRQLRSDGGIILATRHESFWAHRPALTSPRYSSPSATGTPVRIHFSLRASKGVHRFSLLGPATHLYRPRCVRVPGRRGTKFPCRLDPEKRARPGRRVLDVLHAPIDAPPQMHTDKVESHDVPPSMAGGD
ncbi:hypothetical protein GGX14DRAFT_395315 [Mycena pura]|uniref:Uncharacterized protein n=1 Tax=Mycena pura TaxID=153505 RepID=A0AAD6VEQ2_9AGAR|nr:hypothetical protein GGX14DRAFT_395315 [Mycena pura]